MIMYQVGLTREEHDRLLEMELKRNPFKYTVRQVRGIVKISVADPVSFEPDPV